MTVKKDNDKEGNTLLFYKFLYVQILIDIPSSTNKEDFSLFFQRNSLLLQRKCLKEMKIFIITKSVFIGIRIVAVDLSTTVEVME